MIVIFGATTDIGRRLVKKLTAAQFDLRKASRSGDGDINADLSNGVGVREAMLGAEVVVSCAHARFTEQLLLNVPSSVKKIVLTGSAWRYSTIPNKQADEVRNAEALFRKSNFSGVMLHPTMIYGGQQENNIRRLLHTIRQLPVVLAPGGGHQIVQPIYIDDVVDSLFAAATKDWVGRHVVALAGPPLTWRAMVEICGSAINCQRRIINVPAPPVMLALSILNKLGIRRIDANVVRRFGENVDISISEMIESLSIQPRDFETGIRQAVANWKHDGLLL